MSQITLIILSLILFILPACAEKKRVPPHHRPSPAAVKPQAGPSQTSPADSTQTLLNAAYKEWAGVPHRDGGLSKRGIDCSGFVHVVFKDTLEYRVPRTTKSLAVAGTPISRQQLQPGDLILFKIRRGVNHVGIYTGDDNFIHASKSKGVWRSKLSLKYWQDHYWQSRRVLP